MAAPVVRILGPRDPRESGAHVINTTSRSRTWSQGLSPFLLGPCALYDDYLAQTMENGWQYAKLYPVHADRRGRPTAEYWRWAQAGWTAERAVRYPLGRGQVPLCSLWRGERLDYLAARRRIYVPLYRRAVRETAAWRRLRRQFQREGRVTLWDFDGYDYLALGRSLREVLDDPRRKMGHAFVLAMMLLYGDHFKISELE